MLYPVERKIDKYMIFKFDKEIFK